MRPLRRKISSGIGSRGIRAMTATNTWMQLANRAIDRLLAGG